jgi:hypothetical protein
VGGYIRVDKDQPEDPRLVEFVERVVDRFLVGVRHGGQPGLWESGEDLAPDVTREFVRNAILGGLVRLWVYADTHIRCDNTLPMSVTGAAKIMGLPVEIVKALPDDWMVEHEDRTVELPDYVEKNGLISREKRREEKRAINAERQRRHRAKQKGEPFNTVTRKSRALPTRNGRDSNAPTGTGPGTGTGPLDRTGPVPEKSRENPAPPGGELAGAVRRLARRETPQEEIERNRRDAARIAASYEAKS